MRDRTYKWVVASLAVVLGVALSACQRRCQAPEPQGFRSLVETEWRLVETTDPELVGELDRFNFRILTFGQNFTGQVVRVVDNDKFDAPILTLVWVPDPQRQMVRIQFRANSSAPLNSLDELDAGVDEAVFDYHYRLGQQLEMFELRRGYYYRYVPFKGVLNPDEVCSY